MGEKADTRMTPPSKSAEEEGREKRREDRKKSAVKTHKTEKSSADPRQKRATQTYKT